MGSLREYIKNKKIKEHLCRKNKPFLLLITLLSLLFLSGCSSNFNAGNVDEEVPFITKSDFLLNTVVTINLYDKQDEALLEDCFDLIAKYEKIYSRTSESSELYALNYGTAPHDDLTYQISNELSDILKYGLYYSKLSGGYFDISVAPITSLWDFTAADPVLPREEELQAALPLVNYDYIQLNHNQVSFAKDGIGIDLGAIAKGYIADRLKEFLISNGVNSAMLNLGGNVLCVGEKPEGIPFQVGIQKPFADRNETIAVMEINDLSVVSSGIYERYFTLDGVNYHHILNPKTGYPYDNELVAVTIISKKSTDGDGLSTTCFALGLDKGLELIASLPDTYAVFITKDYEVYYSKGFEEAITLVDQ
jgi:thiamine biosynthesis lipoprotein